jgi:hypothetical protein
MKVFVMLTLLFAASGLSSAETAVLPDFNLPAAYKSLIRDFIQAKRIKHPEYAEFIVTFYTPHTGTVSVGDPSIPKHEPLPGVRIDWTPKAPDGSPYLMIVQEVILFKNGILWVQFGLATSLGRMASLQKTTDASPEPGTGPPACHDPCKARLAPGNRAAQAQSLMIAHSRHQFIRVAFAVVSMLGFSADAKEAPIDFAGVFSVGTTPTVLLVDKDSGVSAWFEVGRDFETYHIESYDSVNEVVTLRNSGKLFRIKLKVAKVKSKDPAEIERIHGLVRRNLKNISGTAIKYFLERQGTHVTLRDLIRYDNQLLNEEPTPIDGENYDSLDISFDREHGLKELTITTASGIVVSNE